MPNLLLLDDDSKCRLENREGTLFLECVIVMVLKAATTTASTDKSLQHQVT